VHDSMSTGRLLTAAGIAASLAGTALGAAAPARAAAAPTPAHVAHVAHAAPAHAAAVAPAHAVAGTTPGPGAITAQYAEIEDDATGSELWGQSEDTQVRIRTGGSRFPADPPGGETVTAHPLISGHCRAPPEFRWPTLPPEASSRRAAVRKVKTGNTVSTASSTGRS
jgi:hypothetical protein